MTSVEQKVAGIGVRSLSFVVFSDDWGEHMSSSQHLFRKIAKEHPVTWINTIGMRDPALTLRDVKKAGRKLWRMWFRRRSDANRKNRDSLQLTVCQPLMLPFGGWLPIRAFNRQSVTRAVRATVGRMDGETIVVATVPNAGDYGALLEDATVVYYCVDDFALWPGHKARLIQEMERELIQRADVLVAASSNLHDRLASFGKPTLLLTHGVDIELFSRQSPEHPCFAGVPKPRAGFFGLIDARFDESLLAQVIERMPNFSFVLSGPMVSKLDRLAGCSNVHLTGPVQYDELPSLVAGLDVLFIPYSVGELAETLSPLKLKEYLATGKPIVSTPIAEARAWAPYVATASSADEWVRELRLALEADPISRRGIILPKLEAESWTNKAHTLLNVCKKAAAEGTWRSDAGARSAPTPNDQMVG